MRLLVCGHNVTFETCSTAQHNMLTAPHLGDMLLVFLTVTSTHSKHKDPPLQNLYVCWYSKTGAVPTNSLLV